MTADARAKILAYLADGADKGPRYYKSKHIASELKLTPKEVGVNMGILQGRDSGLRIDKWGYSKSTTWRVERTVDGTNGSAAPVNGQSDVNGHGTNGHAKPIATGAAEAPPA